MDFAHLVESSIRWTFVKMNFLPGLLKSIITRLYCSKLCHILYNLMQNRRRFGLKILSHFNAINIKLLTIDVVSPHPLCDDTPSASALLLPRQMPGARCPYL